jgi:hypothetical protein
MRTLLDAYRHGSTKVDSNFGDYAEQESVFITISTTPDYDKSVQIHFTQEQYIDFLTQMKALMDHASDVIDKTTNHTAVFI